MRGVGLGRHDVVKQGRDGGFISRAGAVVSAATAVAVLLLTNTIATASNLSTTAAQMTPGTFVEITGMSNWNNGLALSPSSCTQSDVITEYANTAAWNSVARRFQFVGAPHGNACPVMGVYYDEGTNSWGQLPNPSPGTTVSHAYGHNAMNPATGEHFYREYNSTNNLRLNAAGTAWTSLAPWPTSVQVAGSQAFFPDRNSLIRWDGSFGLGEYSVASNSWTMRAAGEVAGCGGACPGKPQFSCGTSCYPTWSVYSARCRCVIFGGGSVFAKYNSDGTFTTLTHSGGPSQLQCCASGGLSVNGSFVVDPVTGNLIVLVPPGVMRVFDPGTTNEAVGTWSSPNVTIPSFFNAGPNGVGESLISAPVSTYGVIMYVKHDDANTGRVFLYKHGPGTPQTTPGIPSNITAR